MFLILMSLCLSLVGSCVCACLDVIYTQTEQLIDIEMKPTVFLRSLCRCLSM
ncbi:hypothetical protein M758_3G141800 [Ceratodon purpureus]|nr:hypothetical protein M758_3G141800 [Ceratodon purpureus]